MPYLYNSKHSNSAIKRILVTYPSIQILLLYTKIECLQIALLTIKQYDAVYLGVFNLPGVNFRMLIFRGNIVAGQLFTA